MPRYRLLSHDIFGHIFGGSRRSGGVRRHYISLHKKAVVSVISCQRRWVKSAGWTGTTPQCFALSFKNEKKSCGCLLAKFFPFPWGFVARDCPLRPFRVIFAPLPRPVVGPLRRHRQRECAGAHRRRAPQRRPRGQTQLHPRFNGKVPAASVRRAVRQLAPHNQNAPPCGYSGSLSLC